MVYVLSILKNVQCALEKNIYSAIVEWSILHMSVKSNWFIVFRYSISLFIFCLVVPTIIESRVLKSPSTIFEESTFSLSFCGCSGAFHIHLSLSESASDLY